MGSRRVHLRQPRCALVVNNNQPLGDGYLPGEIGFFDQVNTAHGRLTHLLSGYVVVDCGYYKISRFNTGDAGGRR